MINLAVIEIKDVIKYLVRITIVIAIVVGLTRYFFNMKTETANTKINSDALLHCLDTVIPNIKEIHKKDKVISENEKKIEPLKMTLGVELGMINHLTKKYLQRSIFCYRIAISGKNNLTRYRGGKNI